MPKLTLIPLILTLGLVPTAWADSGTVDDAPLFKTPLHWQQLLQARPFQQLAQGATEFDMCVGKCEEELNSCRESGKSDKSDKSDKSGKSEKECDKELAVCQDACEDAG